MAGGCEPVPERRRRRVQVGLHRIDEHVVGDSVLGDVQSGEQRGA